jgi:hypothetical protein
MLTADTAEDRPMNVPAVVHVAARRLARFDLAPARRPFSPSRTTIRRAVAHRELVRNVEAAFRMTPLLIAGGAPVAIPVTGPRAWWERFVREHVVADIADDLDLG